MRQFQNNFDSHENSDNPEQFLIPLTVIPMLYRLGYRTQLTTVSLLEDGSKLDSFVCFLQFSDALIKRLVLVEKHFLLIKLRIYCIPLSWTYSTEITMAVNVICSDNK